MRSEGISKIERTVVRLVYRLVGSGSRLDIGRRHARGERRL